jgi:hypothetical protein
VSEPDDRFRDWDAAYVLGALDADDRREFERHLASCPACSSAVAEFAGLPGILGKLSPDEAVALVTENDVLSDADEHLRAGAHTPGRGQRLAARTNRRRRRFRIGVALAAVAIVALVVGGGIFAVTPQPSVSAPVAMGSSGQNVITASMSVTPKAWGTRFDWSCSYPGAASIYAAPVSYDLVVIRKSGSSSVVASWSTSGKHAAGLSASSDIAYGDIRSVEIRLTGSSQPLLRENL